VDGSGNVYATGYSDTTWNGPSSEGPLHAKTGTSDYSDIFVLKLTPSGEYQWHTFYGGSANDWSVSVAFDGIDGTYLAGRSFGSWTGPSDESPLNAFGGANDAVVLKLSSDGAYQWHAFFGSAFSDNGQSITVDGSGNLNLTGWSDDSWTGPEDESPLHAKSGTTDYLDLFVVGLSSSGEYQWHTFYGAPSHDDGGMSIAVDSSDDLCVTGWSDDSWTGPSDEDPLHEKSGDPGTDDFFVLKLAR
jgi:hypothetical protein